LIKIKFFYNKKMSISLLGSINVCKVNTGWADKIQSDRFENPSNLLCPLWNGQDNFGRFVHPDSFITKNAGCNSADDRIAVENFLRPQYMEYVALDAAGFQAPLYGNGKQVVEGFASPPSGNMFTADAMTTRKNAYKEVPRIVGSAGYDYSATNTMTDFGIRGVNGNPNGRGCGQRYSSSPVVENFAYDDRSGYNYNQRVAQSQMQAYKSGCTMCNAGF
jgi:hypothetical protein